MLYFEVDSTLKTEDVKTSLFNFSYKLKTIENIDYESENSSSIVEIEGKTYLKVHVKTFLHLKSPT